MRFGHSVKITADNFGSVFKYMLYRIVSAIVFFSIIFVVLHLSLSFLIESAEVAALKNLIKEIVKCIIAGNVDRLAAIQANSEFQNAMLALGRLISSGGGAIAGAVVGVCFIYLAARIVDGLATFALGAIVNDRMSICARKPFSTAFFSTVGQGILYELIYVPLSFLYVVLAVLLCWFLFFYLFGLVFTFTFMSFVISLSLFVTSFILLQTLKMTVISSWIPAMISDQMKVTKAFAYSLKDKTGFGARFACFLVAIYLIVVINVLFGAITVGGALFITLPLSFLFMLSVQFVFYYHEQHKKYFISAGQVYTPESTPPEITENETNK